MPAHVRTQLRDAVLGALTGLPTTGARVYAARVWPLSASDLPGLLVFNSARERVGRVSAGAPRLQERTLELAVVALVAGTSGVDDTLDQIAKEVEVALAMPCAALAGLAKACTLTDTQFDFSDDGDQPIGRAALLFALDYFTTEDAPDVAH